MEYVTPTLSIGGNDGGQVELMCTPGLAIAVAVAGVVWNVGGVYSYALVAVAAAVAAVAFIWQGTGCWPS